MAGGEGVGYDGGGLLLVHGYGEVRVARHRVMLVELQGRGQSLEGTRQDAQSLLVL